jgi:hypothetical protein
MKAAEVRRPTHPPGPRGPAAGLPRWQGAWEARLPRHRQRRRDRGRKGQGAQAFEKATTCAQMSSPVMVGEAGVEPAWADGPGDFKSPASAACATRPTRCVVRFCVASTVPETPRADHDSAAKAVHGIAGTPLRRPQTPLESLRPAACEFPRQALPQRYRERTPQHRIVASVREFANSFCRGAPAKRAARPRRRRQHTKR